jgi:hypothetical protein
MKEKPRQRKKRVLAFLTIIIFINLFSIFYLIDSEISKLCQPSERYNMAESYRPGGEYKSYSENQSVVYSGYVRLAGKGCEKIPGVDIEFWFKDSKGNYTKETRLKVKTDDTGFFQIKTGGFQKGNLPYHIHYLVKGPGIRPMTGNYNNINYNSNDKFNIYVLPVESGNYLEFLSKELSSGEYFNNYDKNVSIITKLKSIENLEKIKYFGYIIQILLFILLFSLLIQGKRKKFIYLTLSILLFISLLLYNDKSSLYDSKTNYLPISVNEKASLGSYKIAEWAPALNKGILSPYTEEIVIPEQENMLSQVFVSSLTIEELEKELRGFYMLQGIVLDSGAVNMWGSDANWQYSYNLSGITIGKEVNITLSKKLGDGRLPPDGYQSVAIIWQIESEKINKYIVDSFKGYGEGFMDLETLLNS